MPPDTQQTGELLELVRRSAGADLTGYCVQMLSCRISDHLKRMGLNAEQYIDLCREDAKECTKLVSAITIHVSSFFRNPIVFEILAQSVLPRLLEKTHGGLRVWSAGCAAGEEAYSVAILLREALKKINRTDIHPLVFATDIDRLVLTLAETALYAHQSLKDTKLGWVDTYFSSGKQGYQLCDAVKSMVHFSMDDLLSPNTAAPVESIYGSFDLILCRNVLIYFAATQQVQVLKKLYDALAPGGYLVLGDSETLVGDLKSRFSTIDAKNRIYQK